MAQSAQAMLDLYIQAEKDVLEGKSTTINGRMMTLEDLDKIRAGRKEWERKASDESAVAAGKSSRNHSLADFY